MPALMNENIRQLLILQDRDMKFTRLEDELESLDPERESAKRDSLKRQEVYDNAKQHLVQLEVRRKDLDNDVETKKEQINKYVKNASKEIVGKWFSRDYSSWSKCQLLQF